jgi:hypothetical protein
MQVTDMHTEAVMCTVSSFFVFRRRQCRRLHGFLADLPNHDEAPEDRSTPDEHDHGITRRMYIEDPTLQEASLVPSRLLFDGSDARTNPWNELMVGLGDYQNYLMQTIHTLSFSKEASQGVGRLFSPG